MGITHRGSEWPCRAFVVALVLAATCALAQAETVVTNTDAVLRRKPGESSASVGDLRDGARLSVLGRKGRWLKVRAGKRTGWIARTQVAAQAARPAHRPAPTAWGARRVRALRSGNTAPTSPAYDVVAAGDDSPRSPRRAAASRLASRDPTEESAEPVQRTTSVRGSSRHLGLRTGMSAVRMVYRSDGQSALSSYRIAARSVVAELAGGLALMPRRFGAQLGIEGHYRVGYSSPGIRYQSSDGAVGDIAFATTEARAGLIGGARLSPALGGSTLAVTAGYHYGAFLPRALDNHGKLAREDLRGLFVGLRLQFADVRGGASLHAAVDRLLAGRRAQTVGLEDGVVQAVEATWARLTLLVPVSSTVCFEGSYRLGRAQTSWRGESPRQPDISTALRNDQEHLVTAGLRYSP